jgi:hypothetical protein
MISCSAVNGTPFRPLRRNPRGHLVVRFDVTRFNRVVSFG